MDEAPEETMEQIKQKERLKVDLWMKIQVRKKRMGRESQGNSMEKTAAHEEEESCVSEEERASKKPRLAVATMTTIPTEGKEEKEKEKEKEKERKAAVTMILEEGRISYLTNLGYKLELLRAKHLMDEKVANSPRLYKVYAAWFHAFQMLTDRGYHLNPSLFNITYRDFIKRVALPGFPDNANCRKLAIYAAHKSDPRDRVLVYFSNYSTVTLLDTIEELFPSVKPTRVILVSSFNASDYDMFDCIVSGRKVTTEVFNVAQLFLNPVRGMYKEQFQFVTEEDLALFSIPAATPIFPLPCHYMLVRYFGLRKGAFLKSIDSFSTANYYIIV